jgi:hypothetical protein
MADSSSAHKIVISDPEGAELRLRALGLRGEHLRGALEDAVGSANLCSEDHPLNFPGLTLWGDGVRSLRVRLRHAEELKQHSWRRDNSGGLPTVVRGDGGMAIALVRGDEGTGNPDVDPSTEHPRGAVTIGRVLRNGVLPEFEHLSASEEAELEALGAPLWLLMHFQTRKRDELRIELSYPTSINRSGFVETWGERIILGPIQLDPARMPVLDMPPVNPDVTVRRRAS